MVASFPAAPRWFVVVLAVAASLATAQVPPPPAPVPEAPAFSQQELDQMLAPIALYPDELLSQILMAATYPLEVVMAARWSRDHPGLRGEEAVKAVAAEPWDPSVKSLVAFPQVLALMDQRLDWTQRLGNAFLAQEQQVMGTVQGLRRRAYAAGNVPRDHVVVQDQAGTLVIVPANPQVVYVPYYDPRVVYGPWWWPAYPPMYWPPWPGYVAPPGVSVGFWWGIGVGVSAAFFFGAFDWPHHHVTVLRRPFYYPPSRPPPGVWRHDPIHRRGVPYRTENVRREFGRPTVPPAAVPRLEYRGREPSAPRQGGPTVRPAPQPPVARAEPPGARTQPPVARTQPPVARTQPPVARAQPPGARPQPSAPAQPRVQAPTREPAPRAFEGIRAGGEKTRQYSSRGQASISHRAPPAAASAPRSGSRAAPQSRGAAPSGAARGHK